MDDIARPLGLSGFWGPTQAPGPMNSVLYGRDENNALVPLEPYGFATWPDGQFNASVVDLARLMAAMIGGGQLDGAQVLEADVVERVVTPVIMGLPGMEAEEDFVGLFWTRETLSLGPLSLSLEGHSGGDPGVTTFMYRPKDSETAFVLMINSDSRGLGDVLALVKIMRTLAGAPLPQ